MAIPGNTTLYLLAGTGLDMQNTIWMKRFAYDDGDPYTDAAHSPNMWLFQWLKAHSICRGYWHMNRLSPSRGYIDVGRQHLVSGAAFGQNGLGEDYINDFLDDPMHQYEMGIESVDYLIWSDDDGNVTWHGAFVDKIEGINLSTVRVYFTIDAIVTYSTYFYFGPCFVEREHCFEDWDAADYPNITAIGTQPESFTPSESDIIFDYIDEDNGNTHILEDLGSYSETFVTSDIRLDDINYIKKRDDYPAFPEFQPALPTDVIATSIDGGEEVIQKLAIGVYRVDLWNNRVFEELGKFDAFEHILYTYCVPANLVPSHAQAPNPVRETMWVKNTINTGGPFYTLDMPRVISDNHCSLSDTDAGDDKTKYKPVNAKSYYAPYAYVSASDCQGSSMEWMPQLLSHDDVTPVAASGPGVFRYSFMFMSTALPNVPCALFSPGYRQLRGSEYDPMFTLWQIPSYSMTPNDSGYGTLIRNACMQKGLMYNRLKVGSRWLLIGGYLDAANQTSTALIQSLFGLAGAAYGTAVAGPKFAGLGMGIGNSLGNVVTAGPRAMGSAVSNIASSYGGGTLNGAVTASNAAANNEIAAEYGEEFGLPKANGGLPSGATTLSVTHVGYKFFFAHVNVHYLRMVDAYFSTYGYTCNQFKYPNINTRRRWNYVKTKNCILKPSTNNWSGEHGFMMPTWAQEQIKQRLNNGITFWNLRHALWGDDDTTNEHGTPTEFNEIDRSIIFGRYVKNYGTKPDSDEMKDNASQVGGYASGFYNPEAHLIT